MDYIYQIIFKMYTGLEANPSVATVTVIPYCCTVGQRCFSNETELTDEMKSDVNYLHDGAGVFVLSASIFFKPRSM